MSQAKVDLHKDQKHNRKEILKKQRRNRVLGITCGTVIAVALVGWVAFSAYTTHQKQQAAEVTYNEIDSSAIADFLSGLNDTKE